MRVWVTHPEPADPVHTHGGNPSAQVSHTCILAYLHLAHEYGDGYRSHAGVTPLLFLQGDRSSQQESKPKIIEFWSDPRFVEIESTNLMAFRSPNSTIPEQRPDMLWWFCQEYLHL